MLLQHTLSVMYFTFIELYINYSILSRGTYAPAAVCFSVKTKGRF
jgi:hypothetical protein